MCGILGTFNRVQRVNIDRFGRQLETLTHRGPDDSNIWVSSRGTIALGSRRLSIQDVSSAGRMPMKAHKQDVWITFNGEIYNFKELREELCSSEHPITGRSDTEVLLAAYCTWGMRCVSKLEGMFAFTIVDERPQKDGLGPLIFAGRDRAGEKPLYYHLNDSGFAISSGLRALLLARERPPSLDPHAIIEYLTFGYVGGSRCMISGYRKLPPAHVLLYRPNTHRLTTHRYWTLPEYVRPIRNDPVDQLDRFRDLLSEAVRSQLISDVPLGIFLSGGLDSSLVAALAVEQSHRPPDLFTLVFPGIPSLDESVFAKQISRHLGAPHHELRADSVQLELAEKVASKVDEPIADSSILLTYLISSLARKHVTVALGGDGGDELLGGYKHHDSVGKLSRWASCIPFGIREAMRIVERLPVGLKGRNLILNLSQPRRIMLCAPSVVFDRFALDRLVSRNLSRVIDGGVSAPVLERLLMANQPRDPVDLMTRVDFMHYLPDDILAKVDRASMAVSLEVRCPWLDRKLVEYCFGEVTPDNKVGNGMGKVLARRLAANVLPPQISGREKRGFAPPLEHWLSESRSEVIRDVLGRPDDSIFNRASILELQSSLQRGYSNGSRVFSVLMFELWRRSLGISV